MAEPMTPEALEAIRARLAAATPGPWHVSDYLDSDEPGIVGGISADRIVVGCQRRWRSPHPYSDADLIAHAPADIAALLAEVERLRAEVARLTPEPPRPWPAGPVCPKCGGRLAFGLNVAPGSTGPAECRFGPMRAYGRDFPERGCGWQGRVVRRDDGDIDTLEDDNA